MALVALATVTVFVTGELLRPAKAATLDVDKTDGGCSDVTGDPYCTIQAAIAAANVMGGDTINVADGGTYDEQVTIDKSLTLTGNTSGSCPGPGIDAPILDGGGAAGDAITIDGGVSGVTIEGFEVTNYDGSGVLASNATSTDDVTVRDNHFHDLSGSAVLVGNDGQALHDNWLVECNQVEDAAANAIELTNAENSAVRDNEITGGEDILGEGANDSENGIVIRSEQFTAGTGFMVSTVEVDGNTVAGPLSGSGIEISALDHDNNRTAAVEGIAVSDNTVDGTAGVERGLYVFADGVNADIDMLEITGNVLDGNVDGVQLEEINDGALSSVNIVGNDIVNSTGVTSGVHVDPDTSAANVAVNCNNIEGNTVADVGFGINHAGDEILDAENNWWGDASGPTHGTNMDGIGDAISGDVDFTPFLTAPAPEEDPCAPPTPTVTNTPTITRTPTVTNTPTTTGTPTVTPTLTVTNTATVTNTPTITRTPTVTNTPTITATPTVTSTPTVTRTPTLTHTPTSTRTPTATRTPTRTATPEKALGDVNDDGFVDSLDALFLLQFEADLLDSLPNPDSADVNEDGDINVFDAALVLQFTAGLLGSLPPPEPAGQGVPATIRSWFTTPW